VPIYEYRCERGHEFELMQRFSDEPLTACTECGAPVRKVLTAPAIHFKGSGFHNTDYARRNGSKSGVDTSATSAEGGSGGGDGGGGTKSDGAATTGAKKESSAASTPTPPAKSE
jgi:putative FmdB family regulatory protein